MVLQDRRPAKALFALSDDEWRRRLHRCSQLTQFIVAIALIAVGLGTGRIPQAVVGGILMLRHLEFPDRHPSNKAVDRLSCIGELHPRSET